MIPSHHHLYCVFSGLNNQLSHLLNSSMSFSLDKPIKSVWQIERVQVCMQGKMHKKRFFLLLLLMNHFHLGSRCIKTWRKISETSIVGPNNNTATTQDLQLNKTASRLYTYFVLSVPIIAPQSNRKNCESQKVRNLGQSKKRKHPPP